MFYAQLRPVNTAENAEPSRTMPTRPMLSVAAVAELCATRTHTVNAWISTGQLPAQDISTQPGGRPTWRIDPDELDAFLLRRTHKAAPKKPRRRKLPNDVKLKF